MKRKYKSREKSPALKPRKAMARKAKKKKPRFRFVIAIMLLGIPIWVFYNYLNGLDNYIVTAQPAYFIAEPDNYAAATKLIPVNTTFQGPKIAGDWYKVKYENEVGYIAKGYVINYNADGAMFTASYRTLSTAKWVKEYGKLLEHQASFLSNGKEQSLVVTEELKLRENPTTKSSVLVSIPKGKSPMYINKFADWYQVFYDGAVGYVNESYIEVKDIEPVVGK